MVSRMPPAHRSEDLTVHRFGRTDAEAPTLLLLHGLTDSGRCWPDAVARWQDRYRLLAWDARGHGESERFTESELAAGVGETHLADVVDLLEALRDEGTVPPVLVGLSMGGGTAAAVAGARPELLRAVVLEDPVLGGDRFSDELAAELAEHRVAERQRALDDPEGTLADGRREHPTWPEAEYGPWREAKLQTDVGVLRDHTTTVLTPWPQVAAAVAVPALIVLGRQGIWSPEQIDQLHAVGNDRLEVLVVEDAGHCVRRDQPDAFHALVDPWIAEQLDRP
jgi:pimeloyl-ACP methyl ester carboxylesterase